MEGGGISYVMVGRGPGRLFDFNLPPTPIPPLFHFFLASVPSRARTNRFTSAPMSQIRKDYLVYIHASVKYSWPSFLGGCAPQFQKLRKQESGLCLEGL